MRSLVVAPVVLVGLLLAWVAVQRAWYAAFARGGPAPHEWRGDPDALAARRGCGSCGHERDEHARARRKA